MNTNPHTSNFSLMQEQPERFGDSELETMMEAHDRQPDTEAAWQHFEKQYLAPQRRLRRWLQVAASVAIVALGAVLAYAVISHHQSTSVSSTVTNQDSSVVVTAEQLCEPLRLDSLLDGLGQHYAKAVCFRDDDLRALRFVFTWEQDAQLEQLLIRLNQFDGLYLNLKNDTIFVEKEEEQP